VLELQVSQAEEDVMLRRLIRLFRPRGRHRAPRYDDSYLDVMLAEADPQMLDGMN
jgi:hypothetical protein